MILMLSDKLKIARRSWHEQIEGWRKPAFFMRVY